MVRTPRITEETPVIRKIIRQLFELRDECEPRYYGGDGYRHPEFRIGLNTAVWVIKDLLAKQPKFKRRKKRCQT